jgi:dCTP deaminase
VSREAVHVPADYAAEMVPSIRSLENSACTMPGSLTLALARRKPMAKAPVPCLKVRSREVPFLVEHGQMIGRLVFETMRERPTTLYGAGGVSNYQAQGLKLSKHFPNSRPSSALE